jgi:integrase
MNRLSEFMRMSYAPTYLYGQKSIRTIEAYLDAVCKYIKYTGDPLLTELNPQNHAKFFQGVRSENLADQTIRKFCQHLNTIWSKAGPPGPRNRDALRYLEEAPWIRPPTPYRKLPREVLDSDADKLYNAIPFCSDCYAYPKYLDMGLRPVYWKAIILLVSTTAIRRKVVFNLTWDDFAINHTYFVVPAHLDKCRSERRKPVHPEVLRLLQAIQTGYKILPWKHDPHKFDQILHQLNEIAGITPHIMLHDLKRYSLQLACRSGVDPATLQMLGDHSTLKTTLDFYVREKFDNYVATVRLPGKGGGQ